MSDMQPRLATASQVDWIYGWPVSCFFLHAWRHTCIPCLRQLQFISVGTLNLEYNVQPPLGCLWLVVLRGYPQWYCPRLASSCLLQVVVQTSEGFFLCIFADFTQFSLWHVAIVYVPLWIVDFWSQCCDLIGDMLNNYIMLVWYAELISPAWVEIKALV